MKKFVLFFQICIQDMEDWLSFSHWLNKQREPTMVCLVHMKQGNTSLEYEFPILVQVLITKLSKTCYVKF